MSHGLKELTSQEIELTAGGSDQSPAQAAEKLAKITQHGQPSAPEQWETQWPLVLGKFYRPRTF